MKNQQLKQQIEQKVASDQKSELQLQGEAQRFKNLTIFRGVAESDENGNAELNIKVPNFFGQMRVFVVGMFLMKVMEVLKNQFQ